MGAIPMSRTLPVDNCESRVNKNSQGDLFTDAGSSNADRWQNFLRVLGDEVDRISVKRLAGEVDEKASVISNALAERDRHYFHAEWLVWVIANGPTVEVLRFLASMRHCDVVPREVLTPEEELTRTKQALAKHFGPAGSDLIRREVYGR